MSKKLDSVWAISEVNKKYHPDKQLVLSKNRIKYFSKKGKKIVARQQLKTTYYRNGAAYVFSRKAILREEFLPKNSGYIIIKEKLISIDTNEDINEVEKFLLSQ